MARVMVRRMFVVVGVAEDMFVECTVGVEEI